MILPVIMAGGSGTRLWPLSRGNYPKQFLTLNGELTMLQNTVERLRGIPHEAPILICNEEHRFIAAEQLRQIGVDCGQLLLEPVGRNTAPAIALAAFKAIENGDDPLLLVLAADHVIEDTSAFLASVEQAQQFADAGKLVTFGIVADKPETGYGYIKCGDSLGDGNGFNVAEFVEKPDLETAKSYLDSGDFLWNSGMFLFKASTFIKELERLAPAIYEAVEKAVDNAERVYGYVQLAQNDFEQCPEDSIDYAVMEKSNNVSVVPMDAGWSDLGSWSSLWDIADKDDNGSAHIGDVISINSQNNLVHSSDKLVATIGLENTVIVETKDALLIADKNQVQDVKKIVEQLKGKSRTEHLLHREVHRPWGCYDSIDNGSRYQVKRITVKPGASLSLQMHHHRAEHWVVVSGTAIVQVGEKEQMLTENQSVYIPIGETHRLTNPGKLPLELIEVQSGSYLGEDDIVRFEDVYERD